LNTSNDPAGSPVEGLRLADFIRGAKKEIIAEWISFAGTRTPASTNMTKLALRDHIEQILNFLADDIESAQTRQEQLDKSHGEGPDGPMTRSAAEVHASLRHTDGFNIDQMVSEYRALRASVVKQWSAHNQSLVPRDIYDLTRFNEAIDQAITESIAEYTKLIDHSRNMFLGILGHDLRNPIGAASMAAQALVRMASPDTKQKVLASQIVDTTERGIQILNDLLDITRSSFGTEIPVVKAPMDMGQLGVQLVDEMRAFSKGRDIQIHIAGDTAGEWDRARIGQVFSNLLGNALQYSFAESSVSVTVAGGDDQISISVHNDGSPIPADKTATIFESLTRGQNAGAEEQGSTHLGLGLFIAKKIITAHGGTIGVVSSAEAGTTFTVQLPRHLER
jgi:signal transduction histidine kinase